MTTVMNFVIAKTKTNTKTKFLFNLIINVFIHHNNKVHINALRWGPMDYNTLC